jgi:hypothetical protein
MKKMIKASLIAAVAITSVNAAGSSLSAKVNALEAELIDIKAKLNKQNKKLNKVKAHDANDNIKWSADMRTAIDSLSYDMANGSERSKNDLMSMRLWLNMAYAPDTHNIFKGQLSMNKAFGADFYNPMTDGFSRTMSMGGGFDWTGNEALTDNSLKVRQAYWLYLGDDLLGSGVPWTFSVGRRPSTNGFLANFRDNDAAQSPLGHVINVEFDGLSSKLDLSGLTGVSGMSFKVCMGQGSTNSKPLFDMRGSSYDNDNSQLEDIKLAGFIFEPYNDGQYVVKSTWYKAFDLPGMEPTPTMGGNPQNPDLMITPSAFSQFGNMQGAALSVLVDGLTEDGFLADTKVFGSLAWSKTDPDSGKSMLGSSESETGTSYWLGAQWKCLLTEKGKVGVEYNHGSKYWRPFTYAEDTLIGSKIAARGDAIEAYFTYQFTDAISAQLRYTKIDYDYTGSNGFFGNYSGGANKISDIKQGAAGFAAMGGTVDATGAHNIGTVTGALMGQGMSQAQAQQTAGQMAGAALFSPNVVESAEDIRFNIRYRF